MSNQKLDQLRSELDKVNLDLLSLINKRGDLVKEIGQIKEQQGMNRFDPVRERAMLDQLSQHNDGPFEDSTIVHLFKEIFKAALELQEDDPS